MFQVVIVRSVNIHILKKYPTMDEDVICDLFSICYNEFSKKKKQSDLDIMSRALPEISDRSLETEFWSFRKPVGESASLQPLFS